MITDGPAGGAHVAAAAARDLALGGSAPPSPRTSPAAQSTPSARSSRSLPFAPATVSYALVVLALGHDSANPARQHDGTAESPATRPTPVTTAR